MAIRDFIGLIEPFEDNKGLGWGLGVEILLSLVYAKCTQGERLQLWESMQDLENLIGQWVVGGDFNDKGFKERKYTWWNGRTYKEYIFERLDRVWWNDTLHNIFPVIE
ncbi:hypothetical protein H5410_065031, partial [Solanum commersonii]